MPVAHEVAWANLIPQQRIEILILLGKHWQRTQNVRNLKEVLPEVFSSWDASQKPPVPVVSYPRLNVFSLFASNEVSGSKRARSPDSGDDTQRHSKKRNRDNIDPDQDPPEDSEAKAPVASKYQEVTNPKTMAQHIVAREASNAEHYKKQNMDILVFLVRKYLYNAGRTEPWSPEDDGKPRVSMSDMGPQKDGDCLNQCIGLLHEIKSAYEDQKRSSS